MAKKKYTLYLPVPLARKLDQVARDRHGAKSALVEEALRASLEPQQHVGIEEGLARRLDQISRQLAALARDQTVATETLGLFVRYFLTATPPVRDSDQESARLTGRKRYEVLLAEVGKARRRGSDLRGRGAADHPHRPAGLVCGHAGSAKSSFALQRSGDRTRGTQRSWLSSPFPWPRRHRAGAGRCCARRSDRPLPPRSPIPPSSRSWSIPTASCGSKRQQ